MHYRSRSKETPGDSDADPSPSDTIILRKKRTIRYEDLPLSIRKRLAENLETISDYEDDLDDDESENLQNLGRQNLDSDNDDHSMGKREAMIDQEESSNRQVEDINSVSSDSRIKRDRNIQQNLRTKATVETAKSQLERVEKKVATEIRNLKKRSKSSKNHSQIQKLSKKRQIINPNISPLAAHPRLLKIEVDTFEIGREGSKDTSENDRLKKSDVTLNAPQNEVRREVSSSGDKIESENKDEMHEREVGDRIQKRIEALKEKVKREAEESSRIKEIVANNAKYDELMKAEEEEAEEEMLKNALGESEREKRLEEDISEDSDSLNGVDPDNADAAEETNSLHEGIQKRSAAGYDEDDDDGEFEEEIKLRRKGNPKSAKFKKSVMPRYENADDGIDSKVEGSKSEVKLRKVNVADAIFI